VFWHLSRRWPAWLRRTLRIVLLLLLVTPYISDPDKQLFAPAFLICVFEMMFGDHQLATNASKPLLAVLTGGMLLSFLLSFMPSRKRR